MMRLHRGGLAWLTLLLVLAGCRDEPGPHPRPRAEEITTGEGLRRLRIDPVSLDEALRARDLPALATPLPPLEIGRGRAFVAAFEEEEDPGTIGLFLHVLDRREAAEAAYRLAAEAHPEEPRWPHYRGDLAERAGDLESARIHFHEAMRRAPRHPSPALRLVRIARDLGEDEALDRALADLLERDPDNVYGRTERGARRLASGDLAGARRDLIVARTAPPGFRRVQQLLGELERRTGNPRAAETATEAARAGTVMGLLSIDPWMAELEKRTDSLLYLRALAEEHWQARRWTRLRPLLQDLERRESTPDQIARLAQTHLYLRDLAAAERTAAALIAADGNDARGYEVRARVRLAAGDDAGCAADIAEALARAPDSAMALETRVRRLLAGGRRIEAEVAARELRGRRPDEVGPALLVLETLRAQHEGLGGTDPTEARRLRGLISTALVEIESRFGARPQLERVRAWLEEHREG